MSVRLTKSDFDWPTEEDDFGDFDDIDDLNTSLDTSFEGLGIRNFDAISNFMKGGSLSSSGHLTSSTNTLPSDLPSKSDIPTNFDTYSVSSDGDQSDADYDENAPLDFDDLPSPSSSYPRRTGNPLHNPAPTNVVPPFWFGEEDESHTKRIFAAYEALLGIDKAIAKSIRSDPPFIGRIQRRQLTCPNPRTVGVQESYPFMTLDSVEVFLNEPHPIGMSLPVTKIHHIVTTWDSSCGLPSDSCIVTRKVAEARWKPLVRKDVYSWLFCLPENHSRTRYTYSSGKEERSIRYSNETFTYQNFLPKRQESEEFDSVHSGSPGAGPIRFFGR